MKYFQQSRKILTALALILILTITTACGSVSQASQRPQLPAVSSTIAQIERGSTATGQKFGDWVVSTAKGLVQDAYVRDNNKLGVVISSQVKSNEVKDLARSLLQGFHKNFPDRDLTVLMYAPDKKLILTARYDEQSKQINYQ